MFQRRTNPCYPCTAASVVVKRTAYTGLAVSLNTQEYFLL